MKTIAIIPAYNEDDHLSRVLDQAASHVDHIIVVDDGSKKQLGTRLRDRTNVTVLRHRVNLGKGAALKTGIVWALNHGYEVAVFLDADGQHHPDEIPSLIGPVVRGQADIVFGTRLFHKQMPIVARFGNRFLSLSVQILFRVRVEDTQSGFRAIRLRTWPQLAWDSARYGVETEMIVNVGKHHLRYAQVPISTIYLDKYKGTTVLDGIRIVMNMIVWKLL